MTSLAILCAATVGLALLRLAHQRRSLAERAVDVLYSAAHVAYGVARAADSALCAYRVERQRAHERHEPMYVEVLR